MSFSRCFAPLSVSCIALASLGACDKSKEPAPLAHTTSQPAPAPENTASNRPDGAASAKTPMNQSESSASIKISADIRRAIMEDKSMSMNAQNCKVITDKDGLVTLRGVVNSQDEKDSIEAKAKAVMGVTGVENQLEVKSN